MATNGILPWAQTDSANTLSDAEYTTDVATGGTYADGVNTGQASSKQANKTWRQATAPAAGLGQFLVDNLSVDVTDADVPATFSTRIANAVLKLAQISNFNPTWASEAGGYKKYALVSDSSGNFWVSTTDQNTTVPGADGSSWTNLFKDYATLNGGNTFTGVQIVPAVTDWTTYQAVGAKDADARYVTNQAAIGGGTGITSAIIDGTTSAPSFLDSDGAWHVVQPHGDYATNTALSQEASARADAVATLQTNINNEATAREDADALKANLSGGNSFTGTQTVNGNVAVGVGSGWSGGTTTGSGRWANGHIGFGSPDGNQGTYTGYLQVTDLLGSPGDNYSGMNLFGYNYAGTRTDYTFSWNGRITTPLGLVAVQSDLPTSGTTGNSGAQITVGSIRILQFQADNITSTAQWVAFPVAFSGTPSPPTANVYGSGDQDTQIYGATASGCYVKCPSGSNTSGQPVSIIVMGPA